MGRWEPNARGRLAQAAMELYTERGFEQTTVAEIAERAGLTKRTFFRHYTDKRDVLFAGAAALQTLVVDSVAAAPPGLAPIAAVAEGLGTAAATTFADHDGVPRARQAVIEANPELQERELVKLATLGAAVTEALRGRGVDGPTARLAAEAGITAFRIAFERWITGPPERALHAVLRETFDDLRDVTSRVAEGRGASPGARADA
ncbi:TetR family transcriptional regulator [Streptomyces fuscigenes]|uniref:TetR family transcriptional regulator n=1 Tax=Streptomyces fuscigenes TaxID=1528880 RepID=UPI001F324322|nr:TetR family transcriptional regulator [Streptomyces fuscigenes]MCF3961546.1 TetR/AcrR family transcriptional regulator [Streptomyces fuscigenes]